MVFVPQLTCRSTGVSPFSIFGTESITLFTEDTQNLRQCQSSRPAPHPNSPSATPTPHHKRNSSSTEAGLLISEVSSIGPSQSASQVNVYIDPKPIADPFIVPNAPNPILGENGSEVLSNKFAAITAPPIVRPSSTPPATSSPCNLDPLPRNHSMINVTYVNKPAPGFEFDESRIRVPAAHAIQDGLVPTLTPSSKPKAARTSSGYLTPVSNDDAEDGRKGESGMVERQTRESFQHERHILPSTSREERPEAIPEGGDAPGVVAHDAADVLQTPRADDSRHPTAPPPKNLAPAPTEEPRTPPKNRKQSGTSSLQKSGFFSNLKKVFSPGTHRQYGEESARERDERVWEHEGKRMGKEDKVNEKKEKKMEKARLREAKKEERQREVEGRKEQHEKEKREKLREERRRKWSDRQANLLSTDSVTDDERSIEDHDATRPAKKVLIGRGNREQKPRLEEDHSHDIQKESEEIERVKSPGGGYIVKQNVDLQKNLRGGVINSGHVASFDMFKGGTKVPDDSRRRGTTAGSIGDQRQLEGRTTGGSFVFERGSKVEKRSSAPYPATASTLESRPQGLPSTVASTSTKPFPVPPVHHSGVTSTPRSDTKFWENLSNRSGSPVHVSPTINERGESGGSTAAVGLGQGSPKPRQIPVSQPHHGDSIRQRDRDTATHTAMNTPKHRMMNDNTRRAVSVGHGRSISVSSSPPQTRMPPPIAGQRAVAPAAETSESLMSIVDGLARSNRRAWNMGLMEVSKSRENLRYQTGHEPESVGAGSRGTTKGKASAVAVTNGNEGNPSGRRNSTGYGVTSARKDEVVSAKSLSSLPAESLGSGSPHPAPIVKGVREGERNSVREEEADDSASTTSYETGHEDFESPDEEMQKPSASITQPLPASGFQRQEEADKRAVSPPPAIRFKALDRADSPSPASRGELTPGSTPRRRKSVRVSLHPTYSPAPPAIEDEVDQYMRAPFVIQEQVVAPPSVLGTRNQSRVQAPSQPPNTDSMRDHSLSDDDSDANVGYEEAKKMFMMAAQKERDVMW